MASLTGDRPVAAGNVVLAYLGAANRDPEVFADPDTLDITRDVTRAATWGGGAHLCLGRSRSTNSMSPSRCCWTAARRWSSTPSPGSDPHR